MNSGLGQLIKGVLIGVVLILAIIGSMSIFDKSKKAENPAQTSTPASNIPAPSINVANQDTLTKKTSGTASGTVETGEASASKLNPETTKQADTEENSFKPVLENEPEKEPVIQQPSQDAIEYGMLNLSAIDYETSDSLTVNFEIFDGKNKKVAESKNTSHTSFRLPTGQYKVVTTLVLTNSARPTEPIISTQFATIRANSAVQKTFKLEPPSTIGILQVSAKDARTKKIIRANYIIQKENGETVANRQNVASTLFKLKAGSYKVTVKNGQQTDFRTVIIEPGESTKEIFELQDNNKQGRLLVRVFDTRSNKPVAADISIKSDSGTIIQQLKAVNKTELSLPQGSYTIQVKGPTGQSTKRVNIAAGRANSEVFRFDVAEPVSNEVQITDNVKITPTRPNIETPAAAATTATAPQFEPVQTDDTGLGKLSLFALNEKNRSSVKSNFYVQTLSGKHIKKKIYADSATFELKPGTYKVTVRSKNKINKVKTIRVIPGKEISETFLMVSNQTNPATQQATDEARNGSSNNIPNRPIRSSTEVRPPKFTTVPNGFLTVAMQPPRKAHFIISDTKGKKIVELTSVPNGKFKLDTGSYNVTAILGNQRQTKTVRVRDGKNTRISFNPQTFRKSRSRNNAIPAGTGLLRSRIVNQAGQPVMGSLTVLDPQGRVIAQANNVSVATFRLPPATHTLIVNANGLKGSERVKITRGETTQQTFTIVSPGSGESRQGNTPSLKDQLRDRLKEEIRRRF